MEEPSSSESPEAGQSCGGVGVRQQVECTDEEVGQDVLQVVLVGTPHPLHPVLVIPDLALGALGILGVGKDLETSRVIVPKCWDDMNLNGLLTPVANLCLAVRKDIMRVLPARRAP